MCLIIHNLSRSFLTSLMKRHIYFRRQSLMSFVSHGISLQTRSTTLFAKENHLLYDYSMDSVGPVTRQSRRTPTFRRVETRGEAKLIEKQFERLAEKGKDAEVTESLKKIRNSLGSLDLHIPPSKHHATIAAQHLDSFDEFLNVSALNYLTTWSLSHDSSGKLQQQLFTPEVIRSMYSLLLRKAETCNQRICSLHPTHPSQSSAPDFYAFTLDRPRVSSAQHYTSGIEHNDFLLNTKSKEDTNPEEIVYAIVTICRNVSFIRGFASTLASNIYFIKMILLLLRWKSRIICLDSLQALYSIGHFVNILELGQIEPAEVFELLAFLSRSIDEKIRLKAYETMVKLTYVDDNEYALLRLAETFFEGVMDQFLTESETNITFCIVVLLFRLSTLGRRIKSLLVKRDAFFTRVLGLIDNLDQHGDLVRVAGLLLINLSLDATSATKMARLENTMLERLMTGKQEDLWATVLSNISNTLSKDGAMGSKDSAEATKSS